MASRIASYFTNAFFSRPDLQGVKTAATISRSHSDSVLQQTRSSGGQNCLRCVATIPAFAGSSADPIFRGSKPVSQDRASGRRQSSKARLESHMQRPRRHGEKASAEATGGLEAPCATAAAAAACEEALAPPPRAGSPAVRGRGGGADRPGGWPAWQRAGQPLHRDGHTVREVLLQPGRTGIAPAGRAPRSARAPSSRHPASARRVRLVVAGVWTRLPRRASSSSRS